MKNGQEFIFQILNSNTKSHVITYTTKYYHYNYTEYVKDYYFIIVQIPIWYEKKNAICRPIT